MSLNVRHIDTLIVGQGLAGSLLAWQLMRQGQRIVVVADECAPSASRVAAGIFNPVTGQRLVLQHDAEQIIPTARQCYRQLEAELGQRFFHAKTMLRVFKHARQAETFVQRQHDAVYTTYLGAAIDGLETLHAPYGLGEQQQTGYLDTNALLDALRGYLMDRDSYIAARVEYHNLTCQTDAVRWRHLHARRIIFCQGFMDKANPYFDFLPFQPAKGEILTLDIATRLPDCIINAGKWLLPLANGQYKAGATYSHDLSSLQPTTEAKDEIMQALQQTLEQSPAMTVIAQQAGIRPNTLDKHPFVGFHPEQSVIGIFNGFGSKGSMLIPYYAQAFCRHICNATAIPAEADISRIKTAKNTKQTKKPRVALTQRVHQHLQAYLQANHLSIDATAGNGHDTLFLAHHASGNEQVIAFDIQPQAIENTRSRLREAGLCDRVKLVCDGHQTMQDHIPAAWRRKVNLIMFNLGYLPQANKRVITRTSTTLQALDAAIELLALHGRISILAYPGHAGGDEETRAVHTWLASLSSDCFEVVRHESPDATTTAPQWMEVIRQ
ncbi:MAG: FAD-dependent oxidoreductase [Mariprofundus sp.]|nr:FAD-dependent oxidoreductase [Mariprofundus sp.]